MFATSGATFAFIEGRSMFFPFYAFGGMGAISSATFFGTLEGMKVVRQKPLELLDYGTSGFLSGFVVGAGLRGIRAGMPTSLIGGILGVSYHIIGDYLYNKSRSFWIEFRKNRQATTKEVILKTRPPEFDRENEVKYGFSFKKTEIKPKDSEKSK
jgi:hypothetical protein